MYLIEIKNLGIDKVVIIIVFLLWYKLYLCYTFKNFYAKKKEIKKLFTS